MSNATLFIRVLAAALMLPAICSAFPIAFDPSVASAKKVTVPGKN